MSTSPHSLPTPGTQPSKDINKLPIYSDSTYPVGPSVSGEISYIHFPPLSPLSITIITIASLSIALFLWCYIYPMIKKPPGSPSTAHSNLAFTRSLFGLRPKTPPAPMMAATQLFGHHGHGQSEMRVVRPPTALGFFRGSSLSPPSLSPTLSSSPSYASSPPMTPTLYSSSMDADSEVIVAPVNVNILGHVVESRTTPKKGGREMEGE